MKPDIATAFNEPLTGGRAQAIGNDLVYVPAFQLSLTPEFIQKVYTENELAYCRQFAEPLLRYASTWAAKEAVYKALKQLGNAPAGWKNIEIIRKKIAGQPVVHLPAGFQQHNISLTLSHDGDYVWAAALVSAE